MLGSLAASAAVLGPPAATSISAATSVSAAPLAPQGANVVLFMVDDATVEDMEYMPNVKRLLVDQGTTFTRNYSPYPLCCPARATVLTGQYAHNHNVLDNVAPIGGATVFEDSDTIATYLNDDYDTALIGKYLNDFDTNTYIPPGWDTWKVPVGGTTYNYADQLMSINGVVRTFSNTYTTNLYGKMARGFLQGHTGPFFLFLSWVAPHIGTPHEAEDIGKSPFVAPEYQGTYVGPPLPLDPSVNESDVSDKPSFLSDNPLIKKRKLAQIAQKSAQRRESLQSVDDEVSLIMQKVEDMGQLDNTYFLFVSDNGQMQGQHRIPSSKSVPYDPAARVPLIVRGPGVAAGTTYSNVTGLQDLTPTILSMTNQWKDQREAQIDGVSLLRLLNGANTSRAQVIEVAQAAGISDIEIENGATPTRAQAHRIRTVAWRSRGIVTSDGWKYVRYPQTNEVEIYDLNADPYEEENLAGQRGHAGQRRELQDLYAQYKSCDGAACR